MRSVKPFFFVTMTASTLVMLEICGQLVFVDDNRYICSVEERIYFILFLAIP